MKLITNAITVQVFGNQFIKRLVFRHLFAYNLLISNKKRKEMPKYFLLICWLLASCTGIRRAEKFKNDLTFSKKTISNKNSPTDSLEIYYSGCSGFYFKFNGNGLLHDPFLSNNGPMLKISSAKLKIDSALIEKYFE